MNRWFGLGLCLLAAGALGLRLPQLDRRPMHNDEAVNAIKIQPLWEQGRYVYDPNEHHGPTLYYATLPALWLSQAGDWSQVRETTLRLAPVFFGAALILLLALFREGLGRPALLGAGLLTALSPAMVFYSRYFIHELLLVCFTLVLVGAGWRYTQRPHWGWALLAGTGLGLMYATKETFVLNLAALGAAALLTVCWSRWRDKDRVDLGRLWNPLHAGIAGAAAAVVSLLFFTSFFTNPAGPLDSIRSYLPWLGRAGGASPHIHPWYFYLERLALFPWPAGKGPVWSEGLILVLALIGAGTARQGRALAEGNLALVRFITFYTLALTAVYSVIPYKTPWCVLGFLHGMILLAGFGAAVLVRSIRAPARKALLLLLLAAGAGHLGWQAWQASFAYPADRRNPYVYAQTAPDLSNLVEKVEALARVHPQQRDVLVKVMVPDSDYWPLPWYLRGFRQVGWWDRLPEDPYAPIMIVGAGIEAALDEKSNKGWLMVGMFELRPETFLELYVELELWRRYVETRPPPTD